MQQPKGISLDQTVGIVCQNCSSITFKEAFLLRKISKFITGQTEDAIIPLPIMMCTECGTVCNDGLAPEVKELFTKSKTLVSA